MPFLSPEDAQKLINAPVFRAYFDLWCRYRGLLALLAKKRVIDPEHFETQISEWIEENRENVVTEALTHFWHAASVPLPRDPQDPSPPTGG